MTERKAGHQESIRHGRQVFLTAVSQVAPQVLQDLQQRFQRVGAAGKRFEAELQVWGEEWSFRDPWVMDAARNLVQLWKRAGGVPMTGTRPLWYYPSAKVPRLLSSQERRFVFREWGWPIEAAWPRDLFIENTTSRFKAALADYCDRIERLAQAHEPGVKPHPVKRRRKGSPFKHYEWLARFHLGLATPADLAKDAGVKLRAVQVALKETADEIDLSPPVSHARRRPARQRKYRRGPRN